MEGVIIYGSQYGTSKQYAEELANRTGFEACRYEDATDVNAYETIVFVGAVYAGNVLGMKKVFDRLTSYEGKTIVIATVGLTDPEDSEFVANIEGNMKQQLPVEVFEGAHLFHLRGGIDYSKLSFKHKTMMKLMRKMLESQSEEEKTAEARAMLDTYGKSVSFVDFDNLEQIIAVL